MSNIFSRLSSIISKIASGEKANNHISKVNFVNDELSAQSILGSLSNNTFWTNGTVFLNQTNLLREFLDSKFLSLVNSAAGDFDFEQDSNCCLAGENDAY